VADTSLGLLWDSTRLRLLVELERGGSLSAAARAVGIGQPTASEHLKVLSRAGLVRPKRIKQWTFYKRDESRIRELKRTILQSF